MVSPVFVKEGGQRAVIEMVLEKDVDEGLVALEVDQGFKDSWALMLMNQLRS